MKAICGTCREIMPETGPCPRCTGTSGLESLEHLRILSIFHYVVGGLLGLFACFPLMHVFMGAMVVSGAFDKPGGTSNGPPTALFGWFFIVFGAAAILVGWSFAVTILVAGRRLSQRRSHTFCLVSACLCCLFMPFGTILGVFTLLVLLKPGVKQRFT